MTHIRIKNWVILLQALAGHLIDTKPLPKPLKVIVNSVLRKKTWSTQWNMKQNKKIYFKIHLKNILQNLDYFVQASMYYVNEVEWRIYASVNCTIIDSDNGLSPGRRQAIIWTNAGVLLIGPLEANFSEILIDIYTFSFKKILLKMSSGNDGHFGSAWILVA